MENDSEVPIKLIWEGSAVLEDKEGVEITKLECHHFLAYALLSWLWS